MPHLERSLPSLSSPELSLVKDAAMDEALDGLRSSALDPDSLNISRMEVAVLRQWRHEQDVRSLRWWAPFAAALVSGFLLAALCLALLHPSPSQVGGTAQSVAWPEHRAELPGATP